MSDTIKRYLYSDLYDSGAVDVAPDRRGATLALTLEEVLALYQAVGAALNAPNLTRRMARELDAVRRKLMATELYATPALFDYETPAIGSVADPFDDEEPPPPPRPRARVPMPVPVALE